MSDRRRGSDLEILGRVFEADNPELEDNLIRFIRSEGPLPKPVKRFDVRPPLGMAENPRTRRPFVWCAICRRRSHWKGLIYRYPDGMQFIAGKDCAKDHFGDSFEKVIEHYEEEERRHFALSRLYRAKPVAEQLPTVIRNLSKSPLVEAFEKVRLALWSSGSVGDVLSAAVRRNNGVLWIEVEVRDFAAEEARAKTEKAAVEEFRRLPLTAKKKARARGQEPFQSTEAIYRKQRQPVGTLDGQRVVDSSWEPRRIIGECVQAAEKLARAMIAGETEDYSTKQLETMVSDLDTVIRNAMPVAALGNDLRAFFAPSNLSIITDWLNHEQRRQKYTAHRNAITVSFDDGPERIVVQAPKYEADALASTFRSFLDILEGKGKK